MREYPITYHPANVTLSGPNAAVIGETVNIDCTFSAGYGIKIPDEDITATCKGVPVEFTWDSTNECITFVMPDPTL